MYTVYRIYRTWHEPSTQWLNLELKGRWIRSDWHKTLTLLGRSYIMCSTFWEGARCTLRSNKKIGLKLALFGIQLRWHTTFLNSCTHFAHGRWHVILDLPFTTPMLSETSKREKMRLWSIGLFFYPSIAFLPNPDSDSDQHFVSRTSKRLFCVVFQALASGRTASRLRRGILFEIYSLAGNCKMILAMILLMWCSSCCHCFGNTRVTYFFKEETTGCVGKKSVQIQIHVGVFESGDLHGFPTKMGTN